MIKHIKITLYILVISTLIISAAGAQARPAAKTVQKSDTELYLKSGHRSIEWNDFAVSGIQSFDAGNLATAYVFLKRAYDRGCRDALILYRLGVYKELNESYQEAAGLLELAAEKFPKQYPGHAVAKSIHEHAGRALYLGGDYDRALAHLELAIKAQPDNFMLNFMAGQVQKQKGNYETARGLLERALMLSPPPKPGESPPRKAVMAELMVVTCELRDFDACRGYCESILTMAPNDPLALSYRQKLAVAAQKQREMEIIEKVVK